MVSDSKIINIKYLDHLKDQCKGKKSCNELWLYDRHCQCLMLLVRMKPGT